MMGDIRRKKKMRRVKVEMAYKREKLEKGGNAKIVNIKRWSAKIYKTNNEHQCRFRKSKNKYVRNGPAPVPSNAIILVHYEILDGIGSTTSSHYRVMDHSHYSIKHCSFERKYNVLKIFTVISDQTEILIDSQ